MKKKSAFSLIELVFVIVLLGILASLAMGRVDRDLKQEAAETILSHIRLAQQLALRDNKHTSDYNDGWQTSYWQFSMESCGNDIAYKVGSDTSLGGGVNGLSKEESAINPIDGKYIFSDDCENLDSDETPSVLLSKKFGIMDNGVQASGGCDRNQILFDYLGRPHFRNTTYDNPDFSNIMDGDCNLTFTLSTDQDDDGNNDSFSIIIKEETGHAYIEGYEVL